MHYCLFCRFFPSGLQAAQHTPFVPAEAGTQGQALKSLKAWVPASAGTNGEGGFAGTTGEEVLARTR